MEFSLCTDDFLSDAAGRANKKRILVPEEGSGPNVCRFGLSGWLPRDGGWLLGLVGCSRTPDTWIAPLGSLVQFLYSPLFSPVGQLRPSRSCCNFQMRSSIHVDLSRTGDGRDGLQQAPVAQRDRAP
jgi:hypothetical protein